MKQLPRAFDAAVGVGVFGLLLFGPLFLGGAPPWAQVAIEMAVAVIAALWLLRMLFAGELVLRRHPVLWPGLVMAGVVLVQALVPGRSVSPFATEESARLYLAYFGLLIVLSGYLSTRGRIRRLSWVIAGYGALMAALGLANFALGPTPLLWLPKPVDLDRLTATFRNPNHQALYLAMCLFLTLGLVLRPRRGGGRRPAPSAAAAPTEQGSDRVSVTILLVGMLLVVATALTLTLSRGATVSALGGVAVLLLLTSSQSRMRLPLLIVGGLVAFAAYGTWVGMESVVARFVGLAREPFGDLRWPVWQATLQMAMGTPFFGTGLGGYEDAFTRFRPVAVPLDRLVDFAHNDYLQLFAETGLVGLGLLLWALIGLGVFAVNRLAGRRDPFVRGLTMGAFCALVVAALHSLMDFGLHRPANAVLVVAIAAVLPAILTWRQHRAGESVDLPEWRWTVAPGTRTWGAAAVVVALVLMATWLVPKGIADWRVQSALARAGQFERAGGSASLGALVAARRELERAADWDASNPRIQTALAGVLDELATRMWTAGVDSDGRRLADDSAAGRFRATDAAFAGAYTAYRRSLERRPMTPGVHQDFGWFLGQVDGLRRAVRGTSAVSASAAFDAVIRADENLVTRGLEETVLGAQLDPNNALRQRILAEYALTFPLDERTRRRVAIEAVNRALTIDPRLLSKVVDDLLAHRVDGTLVLDAVPQNHTLRLQLARQLDHHGRWSAARTSFEEAITLAVMPEQEVDARLAYGQALLGRGEREAAFSQARQALVAAPRRSDVFVLLGQIYESGGQLTEAETAFSSAVSMAPPESPRQANRYRSRLASFLARQGQGERAIAMWRQAIHSAPNDPWLRLALAETLESRGDGSNALLEFRAAASLGSGDPLVQWEVGRALARGGHIREAIELYQAADRLGQRSLDLQVELADLFIRGGWPDRAAEQYRRVLAARPEHEGARRGLANYAASGYREGGTR